MNGAGVLRSRRRAATASVAFAAGVFAVAAAVALAGAGRAAYWVDEGATVTLLHWSLPDLLGVIRGPEAPLGPYYLLMRGWSTFGWSEGWLRLPSALPMAGAVTLLAVWLRGRLGTAAGLGTAAVMIVLPSYSRFAQEVRPYGLLVLAVTACSLAWWRWRERRDRAGAVWYALSVTALPLVHLLSLTLVLAQVVAAALPATRLVAPADATGSAARSGRGRSGLGVALRTAGLAAWGVAPVLPYVWLVRREATGVVRALSPTLWNAWTTFAAALAGPPQTQTLTWQFALAVVFLAAFGLVTGWPDPVQRPVVGYLVLWAVLPPVVLTLAAVVEKTLVPRYFLACLPAWAALAGLGLLGLARGAADLVRPHLRGTAPVVGVLAALLPLAGLAVGGLPHQRYYRTAVGHDNGDVRPALALLDSPPYRDLPIAVLPQNWWLYLVGAYEPGISARTPLVVGPALGPDRHLVLGDVDPATAERRLSGVDVLAALVRTDDPALAPGLATGVPALQGFAADQVAAFDGWSVVLLRRAASG